MSRTLQAAIDNPDLADRLRQFEVVCKIAIQLNRAGNHSIRTSQQISLNDIGEGEFGLNQHQVRYCVGRTKNWLEDIRNAERLRNAAALKRNPTQFSVAA